MLGSVLTKIYEVVNVGNPKCHKILMHKLGNNSKNEMQKKGINHIKVFLAHATHC